MGSACFHGRTIREMLEEDQYQPQSQFIHCLPKKEERSFRRKDSDEILCPLQYLSKTCLEQVVAGSPACTWMPFWFLPLAN